MGEHEEDPEELLMQPGDRLVHRRGLIDRGEARWLELLAQFDREQLWQADGQLSCVHWLMWRLGFSRGTAFEKLRIAHELTRRQAIAEAFAAGDISYSAVRAITRLDRPDPAVDHALVELAKAGTVRDLEQAVRRYQLCADQERARRRSPTRDPHQTRRRRLLHRRNHPRRHRTRRTPHRPQSRHRPRRLHQPAQRGWRRVTT